MSYLKRKKKEKRKYTTDMSAPRSRSPERAPAEESAEKDEKKAVSRSRSRSRSPKRRSGSRSRSPRKASRSRSRSRSRGRKSRSRSRSPRRSRSRSPRNDEDSKIYTGKAGRWNDRGYSFITPDNGDADLFCHFSAITDGNCLREGTTVEYQKVWDSNKNNYRAKGVTGGVQEDRRPPARNRKKKLKIKSLSFFHVLFHMFILLF